MHRKTKYLSLIMVVLLSLTTILSGCGETKETVKDTEISVNTAVAQKGKIARTERYSGIVRGKNEVYIMPKMPARVTTIYVKPGDRVTKDQVLLRLDSSDLDVAVKQAEANLAGAQAQKRSNELSLENARANYERIQKLHEVGGVSDRDFEAVRMQYDSLSSGTVEASMAQAQAAMEGLQNQIDNCNLSSPIDGIVGSINLSLGETANPQLPAAIVTDSSEVEIEVLVSESEVSYINMGSEVDVLIKAVGTETIKGRVESVSMVADPVKRSYTVKVALENEESRIKSGMFAEVQIATINNDDALYVPRNAVIPRGNRNVVYVLDKEKRAREKEVETGIENSHNIEILKGIQTGEEVITRGNTLVNDGTLVRVITGGEK